MVFGLALIFSTTATQELVAQEQTDFDHGVSRLAATLAQGLSGKTIAVFEFPDLEGRVSNLSRIVSEQITTEMVQQLASHGVVLERRQVIQVLAELRLQRTDLSASEVSRVGQQLGADAILLGSTAVMGEQIVVNARVVSVTGGQVLSAGRMSIHGTAQLLAMAGEGIAAPNLTASSGSSAITPSHANSGTATASRPQSAPAQPAPPAAQSVRTGLGTRFTLSAPECTHGNHKLVCRLLVTNHGDEAQYSFGSDWETSEGTLLVDTDGNVYRPSLARIGNSEVTEFYLWNRHLMVKDLPTRFVLEFEDVPSNLSRIPLLQVEGQGPLAGDHVLVRFRNVDVQP